MRFYVFRAIDSGRFILKQSTESKDEPTVDDFIYEFDGWHRQNILTSSFPYHIISKELAEELKLLPLTGCYMESIETAASERLRSLPSQEELPGVYMLIPFGDPGVDEIGIGDSTLVISSRVLTAIQKVDNKQYALKEYHKKRIRIRDFFKRNTSLTQFTINPTWAFAFLILIGLIALALISWAFSPEDSISVNLALRLCTAIVMVVFLYTAVFWMLKVFTNLDKLLFLAIEPAPIPLCFYPRVLNIAEGLSLASGVAQPNIYSIDVDTTNAFTLSDGKEIRMFITRGALSSLNREELTGLMAHEYAHIKNEDLWRFRVSLKQMWLAIKHFSKNRKWFAVAVTAVSLAVLAAIALLVFLNYQSNKEAAQFLVGLILISILTIVAMPLIFLPKPKHTSAIVGKSNIKKNHIQEYAADKTAVMWTYNPGALASAISKTSKSGYCERLDYLKKVTFAPITKKHFKSIHQPQASQRIEKISDYGHLRG